VKFTSPLTGLFVRVVTVVSRSSIQIRYATQRMGVNSIAEP